MPRKGPLFTLLGGGGLAVVLLIASVNAAGGDDEPDARAGDQQTGASASPEAAGDEEEDDGDGDDDGNGADPATYVGWVDGGGASVAVVIDDEDQATAYVCDGDTVEAWLSGDALNGELLLEGEEGTLTASYDDDEASGETEVDGLEWTFTIEYVAPPEGLYRFADTVPGGAEVDGGWIVLPDGTQVGVLNVDGSPQPAPALDPTNGEVELPNDTGATVTAERQG